MKSRKIKKQKEKIVKKVVKHPLAQEYLGKQKNLIKETLRKIANSIKKGVDHVLK